MMAWIIGAIILNTVWTIWCAQFLPPRVATHFGLGGEPNGWMSRKGFCLFGIFFPIALSAFLVFVGGKAPPSGAMSTEMERLAAGLVLFFSFVSWSIVRSNKKNPPRMDFPSLLVGVVALVVYMTVWATGLPKESSKPSHSPSNTGISQKS